MCSVLRLLHCWPHKCTFPCSSRCGFWSAALLSRDLKTKESFRMCSHCERPGSVVYGRLHTAKLVWLLWGSENVFVFIYSTWLYDAQAWSYRLFTRDQILSFHFKYLLSRPAFMGGDSLCVAVDGMFPPSFVHAYFRGDEPWEDLQRSETVPPFSSLPSTQHLGDEGRTERYQKKKKKTEVMDRITWPTHGDWESYIVI